MSVDAKLYTVDEIRAMEQSAINTQKIQASELMSRAAAALLATIQRLWPQARQLCVVCGKGNNGGDGLCLAELAHQAGFEVQIVLVADAGDCSPLTQEALKRCEALGLSIEDFFSGMLLDADVMVDALLGIGLKGAVRPHYAKAIEWINAQSMPCLAVDIPSGLNADTGDVLAACVRADVTQTFIANKRGLFTFRAAEFRGTICLDDLGVDTTAMSFSSSLRLMQASDSVVHLPKRERDAHKGHYGHVLVIGGDYGMGGAVRMAAEAAMRAGAGLVTVATRPEHLCVVNACRPEIMCQRVESVTSLKGLAERVNVVVVGPGLGQSEWGVDLLNAVLPWKQPKVLDADALNLLAGQPSQRDDWVLTPHPGEAARLLGTTGDGVQHDRFASAQQLQETFGGVIALKGSGTLVAGQDKMALCPFGNPGMASGGMGDILSGIIGGFIAQGMSIYDATVNAVLVHAKAADAAAARGGERGMLALDVLECLREQVNPESVVA